MHQLNIFPHHVSGLNIDTVTCTVLIVCIGLSVDFSVHVIHSFLHAEASSRDEKMKMALKVTYIFIIHFTAPPKTIFSQFQAIASAVLNGGFSTLLAVILLAFSDVYVFVTFFKIFVLVVFFGLYNGLVFLPVILTLAGPINPGSPDVATKGIIETSASDQHELHALTNNEK